MNYFKRILSVIMVMGLTAFAAPAFAEYSSPTSIVGVGGHLAGQRATPSDYSSPVSLVGARGHGIDARASTGDYSSPASLVGPKGHVPVTVASTTPSTPDSGFDWTDGLLGLVAGLALAAMAMAAGRVLRTRRPAASGA